MKRTTTTRRTTTPEKVDDYESYGGSSEITKASGRSLLATFFEKY
jgi:hypothetical protein